MVRVESNNGMNQVLIEGDVLTVVAECLTAVSAMAHSLAEQGVGNIFKAMLIKDCLTGELFSEPDRHEDVTDLTFEEKLDVWGDMEKDRDALKEELSKRFR